MNIKNLRSCDLTLVGGKVIGTEARALSLWIVIRHEFICTWQLAPLEFNLISLISQTDSPPSINSFLRVQNMNSSSVDCPRWMAATANYFLSLLKSYNLMLFTVSCLCEVKTFGIWTSDCATQTIWSHFKRPWEIMTCIDYFLSALALRLCATEDNC